MSTEIRNDKDEERDKYEIIWFQRVGVFCKPITRYSEFHS